MKDLMRRYLKSVFVLSIVGALAVLPWVVGEVSWPSTAHAKVTADRAPPEEAKTLPLNAAHPQIRAVMAVQQRYTHSLIAVPDVVGTATGLTSEGNPAILVFARRELIAGTMPASVDGVPIVVQVTGEFVSMAPPPGKGKPGGDSNNIDPKSRFERPVPIGVSTGNVGECSAGTIGARVKDANGNVYALSNNHVYALENNAPKGSHVLQPGRYDTNCAGGVGDAIGTLWDYEPIDFTTLGSNTLDAATAVSSTDRLGNATPSDGYGLPKRETVAEAIGLEVQKYGRTSSLTRGAITGINATIYVGYSSGTALFMGQIVVGANKPFIKSGDSGSVMVTDPGRNPVGLLFAGTASGKTAIANPIGAVLDRFGVTIDGE